MLDRYGNIVKVVIVGKGGIGKTALCCAVTGKPIASATQYLLTVGVDFHTIQLTVDEQLITIQVSDLAGQKQFEEILDLFVGGAKGAILTYDITNFESYMALHETWIPFLNDHLPGVPKVVVGTKSDLDNLREVTPDIIDDFIQEAGSTQNIVGHVETSAFAGTHIREPFQLIAEAIARSE